MFQPAKALVGALAVATAWVLLAAASAAAAPTAPAGFTVTTFATAPAGASEPDDIAGLGGAVAVAYQNGLGPLGEPSSSGATQSDVALYSPSGALVRDWKVAGHVDGLAAQRWSGTIVATVNEDGNTSLYTIAARVPGAQPVRYAYSPEPDSAHTGGVFTGGGTDGVQVLPDGRLLISASAPNNGKEEPVPEATATFLATLDPADHVAHLAPTFADDAEATDALTGQPVRLGPPGPSPHGLTDPDSNALVPFTSPLYAGRYMLNSQGDQVLVFAGFDRRSLRLTELPMSSGGVPAGVDDVVWASAGRGTIYAVDHTADVVYAISGPFGVGESFAGSDTVGTEGQTTLLDHLDLATGALTPFATGFTHIKGLLYEPAARGCEQQLGGAHGGWCGGRAHAHRARR